MAVVPTGFDMRLGARMRKRGPRIGCLLGAFSVASIFAVCLWWTFQPGSGEYGTSLTMVAEDGFGFALFFAGFITAMAGSYLFLTWRLVLFIRSSWRAGGIPRGVLVTFGFLYLLVLSLPDKGLALLWGLIAPMWVPAFCALANWILGSLFGAGDANDAVSDTLEDRDSQ